MNINCVIETLGFSQDEVTIYINLLELGRGTLSAISRKINKNKLVIYPILKDLIEKGYIETSTSRNIIYFNSISPQRLIELFEIRIEKVKMVLPELSALDNLNTLKPRITYYEGKKGLITIMEDTLTAQGDILNWAEIAIASKTLSNYYLKYIEKRITLNIFVRAILNNNPIAKQFQKDGKLEKREVRLIPKNDFPFKNEINIYNDTVSIISHRELVGVIIQSKDIAETQRSIFKIGWKYAEMINKTF